MTDKPTRQDRILFCLFAGLILWLPVPLGANRPWAWSLLELLSFALFACVLVSNWQRIVFSQQRHTLYFPALLFLSFVAWIWLQYQPLPHALLTSLAPYSAEFGESWRSISLDPAQTRVAFVKSLAYLCLFCITLLLLNSRARVRQLLLVIAVSGICQALYGALELLLGAGHSLVFNFPVQQAATGSFVYKNHFANYLVLCLAAGTGYLAMGQAREPRPGGRARLRHSLSLMLSHKALIRIGLAMMVIALVLSRSRMGNTAFYLSLSITCISALMLIPRPGRYLKWLFVSMMVIDVLIVSSWFGLERVSQRLATTSLASESRDDVLLASLPMAELNLMSGLGGGSYYAVFNAFQPPQIKQVFDHAHNDYLQFYLEYGVVGFTLLAMLVLSSLYQALTTLMVRRDRRLRAGAICSLMAIIAMLLHMAFDFPLQAPANTGLFVILLALTWRCRWMPRVSPPAIRQSNQGHF